MEDKKYQICVAELELTDGDETWFHSFLVMADDCPHDEIADRVFQQIEFDPDENGYLGAKFSNNLPKKLKPHTSFETVIVGDMKDIFGLWNQMKDFASQIAESDIPFGPNFRFEPTSTNCRTGIRDICKAGGLTLSSAFKKSTAGLQAPDLLPRKQSDQDALQLLTEMSP